VVEIVVLWGVTFMNLHFVVNNSEKKAFLLRRITASAFAKSGEKRLGRHIPLDHKFACISLYKTL
jgi:hypothetical protein